ncbi:MAG TPA: GxxExxY protein, partial [Bellilinea sp.]
MEIEYIATQIVDSAIKVHRNLGAGLLESTYQACFSYELQSRGFSVECELWLPINYGDLIIEKAYRVDMIVNKTIIVENKTVENLLRLRNLYSVNSRQKYPSFFNNRMTCQHNSVSRFAIPRWFPSTARKPIA